MLQEAQGPETLLDRFGADADVGHAAKDILLANWTGASTVPSPSLYPHQWSWDSACIAMGYTCFDEDRAETELRTLFRGQWATGLLPHIVFNDDALYFPGPEFWRTDLSPHKPAGVNTSGIVQPPVHATATLNVARRAHDADRADAFLRELYPKLAAWHAYLYRERNRAGDGLIEIWHPWESGMDNTTLWDAPFARIDLAAADVPEYDRVDNTIADPEQRPTDDEYDRYAYLVKVFRDCAYDDARIAQATPFAVQDVLFNTLLVQANRDLAEIAERIGESGREWRSRADQTAAAIEDNLWDEEAGLYTDVDLVAGVRLEPRVGAGFAPLYAGIPDEHRAARLLDGLVAFTVPVAGGGEAVTSVAPSDPLFDGARYWRGPIWMMINWVLHRGLRRYGRADHAEAIRDGCISLVRASGFWEHYNPQTGEGQGTGQFAWSAALVLDLLCERVLASS